jgi:hypothetical protein
MEDIFELNKTQFGISIGAIFTFDDSKTHIKVSEDGTATVTLKFKLDAGDSPNLQIGPGEITIGDCGIFVRGGDDSFDKRSVVSTLKLDVIDETTISIISDRNDVELITTALKGRQGNQLLSH